MYSTTRLLSSSPISSQGVSSPDTQQQWATLSAEKGGCEGKNMEEACRSFDGKITTLGRWLRTKRPRWVAVRPWRLLTLGAKAGCRRFVDSGILTQVFKNVAIKSKNSVWPKRLWFLVYEPKYRRNIRVHFKFSCMIWTILAIKILLSFWLKVKGQWFCWNSLKYPEQKAKCTDRVATLVRRKNTNALEGIFSAETKAATACPDSR